MRGRDGARWPVGHLVLCGCQIGTDTMAKCQLRPKAEDRVRGEPRRFANIRTGVSAGRIWRSIAQVPVVGMVNE